MEGLSKKIYLNLRTPTEEMPTSDQRQLQTALAALGFTHVSFSLPVIRKLYPLRRNAGVGITVSLVKRDHDWIVIDLESGDQTYQHYGLAVDYGSTTIVMRLIDMNSGKIIGEEKAVNGQTKYGTDILTRIAYSIENDSHAKALHLATAETLSLLLDRITESTGINAANCPAMVLSGNTTMIHFLLRLNAWSVFASPYAPVTSNPGFFMGHELGLTFNGVVFIVPAASNYIGGDVISGLIKLDIHKQEETSLFFDIGTNGELVLGNKHWMIAGAGAAGPALEGYISKFGMRAAPGAIDSIRIKDGDLIFTTIGNQKPVGICGSGIIDLLAQMRLHGWINIAGEFNSSVSERIVYLEDEKQYAVVYATAEESAHGTPLFFSQTDVTQYLDTKAAAYTMVECLLDSAGVQEKELETLYLSGAFPAHSDLESAITIGIFPDLPREKYQLISNTSLEGAQILLTNRARLAEAQELAENIYCVQFASIPDFLVRMQAAKFIPHTDMQRYPSIQAALGRN